MNKVYITPFCTYSPSDPVFVDSEAATSPNAIHPITPVPANNSNYCFGLVLSPVDWNDIREVVFGPDSAEDRICRELRKLRIDLEETLPKLGPTKDSKKKSVPSIRHQIRKIKVAKKSV